MVPTTDPQLAYAVLDRLDAVGFGAALLHPLPPQGTALSDIDLVSPRPLTRSTVDELTDRVLRPMGLHLILSVPYDHGALALFATDETAQRGIQLDLVHDPGGRGRLGVHYTRMLDRARRGDAGPLEVSEDDRMLYLLRKRHWKQQRAELQALRTGALEVRKALLNRGAEILTAPARRDVARLLDNAGTAPRFSRTVVSRVLSGRRLLRRLAMPVGYWVHVGGDDGTTARALAQKFGRILVLAPTVKLGDPWTRGLPTWVRAIAPVRWRPGIVFTFGRSPLPILRPDVSIDASPVDADEPARLVVRQLSARVSDLA